MIMKERVVEALIEVGGSEFSSIRVKNKKTK